MADLDPASLSPWPGTLSRTHPPGPREVRIPCGPASLAGDLALPASPAGLVLFVHGSGSGRHSPRNRQVAQALQQAGMATLLFDLLTADEERVDSCTREYRFDIALLTARLECATAWVGQQPELGGLPLGYFGASTGSAAALIAASRLGPRVRAVVSRGGRPDLAGPVMLASILCPTLLVVGGEDADVIRLNEMAMRHLRCDRSLQVVAGASHLFEEAGALEQVCRLATGWFARHLPA